MVRCGLENLVCGGDLVSLTVALTKNKKGREKKKGYYGVPWGPVFSPVPPVYSKHGIPDSVHPSGCREWGQSKACLSEAPG